MRDHANVKLREMSFQTKMESAMSTLQNGVFDKDPTVIGILVAVVVVFFSIGK